MRPQSPEAKTLPSLKRKHRWLRAGRLANIASELKRHAPFTALGALSGIAIMALVVLIGLSSHIEHTVFHSLHRLHIALSAIVTTAVYRRYGGGIWAAVALGLLAPETRFPHAGHVLVWQARVA